MHPGPNETGRVSPATTLGVVVVAALLWLAVAAVVLFVIPFYEHLYAEMGFRLPIAVNAVVGIGRLCEKDPYVLPMFLALIIAAMAISTWWVRQRTPGRWRLALWCLAMLLLPVAVALWLWLACAAPLASLLDGLAGPRG